MTNNNIEKATLNSKEAAKVIGICEQKVLQMLRAGIIPAIHHGRRYIIPKVALNDWLNSEANKAVKSFS